MEKIKGFYFMNMLKLFLPKKKKKKAYMGMIYCAPIPKKIIMWVLGTRFFMSNFKYGYSCTSSNKIGIIIVS